MNRALVLSSKRGWTAELTHHVQLKRLTSSVAPMATVLRNESKEARKARKEQVKAEKAAKRARRQGFVEEEYGQKNCTRCDKLSDLLIRCQIDEEGAWHMVCGKCWHTVSGGIVDGDAQHPYYRYGGLWKNHHKKGRIASPEAFQEHKDMQTSGEHSSADSASEQETESAATPG